MKLYTFILVIILSCNLTSYGQIDVHDNQVQKSFWLSSWEEISGTTQPLDVDGGRDEFQVLAMNYSDLDSIRKNDKFELGIVLPEHIRSQVVSFIESKGKSGINPFDPAEIDVQAVFSRIDNNEVKSEKVFGFYYEEYIRKSNLKGWSKMKDLNDAHFRIRFAPKFEGLWKCDIRVVLEGGKVISVAPPFFFWTKDVGLPGYVKVSENKRYFELDGELFLPVGSNMPAEGSLLTGYRSEGAMPHEFVGYHSQLKDLKDNGANYFRHMITPWTTDIEFEHIGNYSNRLNRAWEMDELIDYIEEIDLRMHFNMSYTTPLSYTGLYSMFFWDWTNEDDSLSCELLNGWFKNDSGYCYHTDKEHGVETIDEFFTNPESIRYYQNRIRYMLARWGYSTHIVAFELMNEINYSGLTFGLNEKCNIDPSIYEYKPYFNDISYVKKLSDWQIEMGRFIKEDLQQLDHPYCANYGGTPNYQDSTDYHFFLEDGISLNGGDESYFSEYVDVMSYNDYYGNCLKYQWQSLDYAKLKKFDQKKHGKNNEHPKPLMYSEMGMGAHGCDEQFTFKQMIVMSVFSGAAGPGLPWHFNNNSAVYDSVADRENAWSTMTVIQNFLEDVPLHKGNWTPGFDVRKDKRAEMLFITDRESSSETAIAVINNRTVNRYTMREDWCDDNPVKCDCWMNEEEKGHFDDVYETPQAFDWKDKKGIGGAQLLKIRGMKYNSKYIIALYDGLTGEFVMELTKRSDAFGNLKIKHPELAASPSGSDEAKNGSMLLVKVYKARN